MGNAHLQRAKKLKNDEYYTRLSDVEEELCHYDKQFKDKVVYCNCDNPYKSAFVTYFVKNLPRLDIKKLIVTCYNGEIGKGETPELFPEKNDRKAWHYERNIDRIGDAYALNETIGRLSGNGDFRSDECVALLKKSDIVVTNPPFSLAKELLRLLIENHKDFILLGHLTMVLTQDVFPRLMSGELRVSKSFVANFMRPDGSSDRMPVLWLTSLPDDREPVKFPLSQTYTPLKHPRHDNYDAIEVSRLADIPLDYEGTMGVPISYIDKHCPEQFEIVGATRQFCRPRDVWFDDTIGKRDGTPYLHGKRVFDRIFIKRKS